MANKHATKDWKSITDDKEKYAAYLCSREWAEKREAVRQRSRGKCERCNLLPMEACHHLSYKRKYNESLEDLQAICNPCHEFTHGKSDVDITQCPSSIVLYFLETQSNGENPCPLFLLMGSSKDLESVDMAAAVLAIDTLFWMAEKTFETDREDQGGYLHHTLTDNINPLISRGYLPFNYSGLLKWCHYFRNDWLANGRLQFYEWCVKYFGMETDETLQRTYGDDDE